MLHTLTLPLAVQPVSGAARPGTARAARHCVAGARDYTELEVWKLADALRTEIYRLTQLRAPRFEPELGRQLRRAAESACANIAEGFSRYLPADFARFLRMTRGSLSEALEHLTSATRRNLLTEQDADAATTLAKRARGACTKLIVYLESATAPGRE